MEFKEASNLQFDLGEMIKSLFTQEVFREVFYEFNKYNNYCSGSRFYYIWLFNIF